MISHKQEGSANHFVSTDRFIIHYAGHLSRESALLTPFAAMGYLHQIYAGAHRQRQQPDVESRCFSGEDCVCIL